VYWGPKQAFQRNVASGKGDMLFHVFLLGNARPDSNQTDHDYPDENTVPEFPAHCCSYSKISRAARRVILQRAAP